MREGLWVLEVWLCNELMLSTLGRAFRSVWQLCCGKTGQGEQEMLVKIDLPAGKTSTPSWIVPRGELFSSAPASLQ
jgi:hypothetical protein